MQKILQKHKSVINTAILSLFGMLGKVASVLFKIILIVLIGTVGIGYYQLTFPLFVFLFSISSVGISTTLTMYIAENGWHNSKANGSISFARITTLFVSMVAGVLLVIFAPLIAQVQGNKEVATIYFSVAFAVIAVSLLTFYRAILRGNKLIREYATSDIIEQISKLVLCIIFASLFIKISVLLSVVGVFIGIALSSVIALIYIMIVLKKFDYKNKTGETDLLVFEKSQFLKNSFVAGLSSVLIPFVQFIESVIVVRLLSNIGFSSIEATSLFGLSRGNISALLNLPSTIILAIEFLLLPDILSLKSKDKISKKAQNTISIALCLGFFVGAMFYIFGSEILGFVYGKSLVGTNKQLAVELLKVGSISVVFLSIGQVQSVVLQGLKKLHLPIISMGIASAIKLLFEIFFIKEFGIYAVEISNVLFYITLCFINTIFLIRSKIYFGSPINLLYVLSVVLWVLTIKILYGFVSNIFSFITAIILALTMTLILFVVIVLLVKRVKLGSSRIIVKQK